MQDSSVIRRVTLRLDRYRSLCSQNGLTLQRQQAEHLGVTEATISRTIRGITQPSHPFIAAACRAFDVPFEYLFEIEETEKAS